MRKKIPWGLSLVACLQTIIIGGIASWLVREYFPNWIIEYQLAAVILPMIIAGAYLSIVVRIACHDCSDARRDQYDIKRIRSQYRKRK